MPQGDPRLHAKWGDAANACQFLSSRGYRLTRGYEWVPPAGRVMQPEEEEAVTYLVDEWDYGGLVDKQS